MKVVDSFQDRLRMGMRQAYFIINSTWLPCDHVRHVIVEHNMLTQHTRESLQVTPGPFPNFLGGA